MDPATLAACAVGALVPYLAEAGREVAKKAGGTAWEGTGKLWTLMRAKLMKPEQQSALAELKAQPTDPDVQGAARVQLKKAASEDAEFARALAGLLAALPSAGQSANVVGHDNIIGQADRGSSIKITR